MVIKYELGNKICAHKWEWQKPKLKKNNIFKVDIIGLDEEKKHSPYTVGFDVSVKQSCELFFDSGKGVVYNTESGAGTDHSFNFTYGTGTHHFCIIARKLAKNEKNRIWQLKDDKITIKSKDYKDKAITNFYQTKRMGHFVGKRGGLDVAFSISTQVVPTEILWDFGDGTVRSYKKNWQSGLSESHIYKAKKEMKREYNFKGSVSVYYPGSEDPSTREIHVKIKMPKGTG